MIGLAYLIAAGVYVWLTAKACGWAWRKGLAAGGRRRAWLYGIGAALVMYHLVLWDFIPARVLHSYYCKRDAGVHVYVSVEEWLAANSSKLDELRMPWAERYNAPPESLAGWKGWSVFRLNKAVVSARKTELVFPRLLGIRKSSRAVIDTRTNELLASEVDYSVGGRILENTLRPQPNLQSCQPRGPTFSTSRLERLAQHQHSNRTEQ